MYFNKVFKVVVLATGFLAGAALIGGAPAVAAQDSYAIKIDKKVILEDSGNPNYSQVAVSVTIKCDESLPESSFYVFVSQPQAPNSIGYLTAQCTGKPEKFTVSVRSNFGTLYELGSATANVTNFSNGISTPVTIAS